MEIASLTSSSDAMSPKVVDALIGTEQCITRFPSDTSVSYFIVEEKMRSKEIPKIGANLDSSGFPISTSAIDRYKSL